MKKAKINIAVWVVLLQLLLVLPVCKKDPSFAPIEQKITVEVSPAGTRALVSVDAPGKFDMTVEWSRNADMDSVQSCSMEGEASSYYATLTGLSKLTTYYYRVTLSNSFLSRSTAVESFTTLDLPTGVINGRFSVSASQRVYFSQGNLQYLASTNTWQFAANQYDYIGNANRNISSSYSGWIDLFGWGTSGYNHGAVCYQPWSASTSNSDYYAYGSATYNLNDQTGQADWGYNVISNGGNMTHQWRTLTREEWTYVFNTRSTSSGIRYAKAQVNNVNGVILLPDDWSTSYYSLSSTNNSDANYSSNVISASSWTNGLQSHGAVFLPAAGYRNGTSVYLVGSNGYYWSASYYNSSYAYGVYFCGSDLNADNDYYRYLGRSVRLVQDYNPRKIWKRNLKKKKKRICMV